MGLLYGSFHGSNDDNIENYYMRVTLEYTDGKVICSDWWIKLGYTNDKVLCTILGNVYGITLGLDVGIDLRSLDGFFDGSNSDTI